MTLFSNYRENSVEDRLWEELERAEEVTDLDLEQYVDSLEIDSSLPEGTRAVTKHREYTTPLSDYPIASRTEIAVNSDFFYQNSGKRLHDMIHEGGHVLDQNNALIPQLKETRSISDEFASKIEEAEGRREREGMNEAITRELDPGGDYVAEGVYPYETSEIRNLLEADGIDVSEELSMEEVASRSEKMAKELDAYSDYSVDLEGVYETALDYEPSASTEYRKEKV